MKRGQAQSPLPIKPSIPTLQSGPMTPVYPAIPASMALTDGASGCKKGWRTLDCHDSPVYLSSSYEPKYIFYSQRAVERVLASPSRFPEMTDLSCRVISTSEAY